MHEVGECSETMRMVMQTGKMAEEREVTAKTQWEACRMVAQHFNVKY